MVAGVAALRGRGAHAWLGEQEVGEYADIARPVHHLRLQSFVVIELEKGKFSPEYAGNLNFYCNVVND